MSRKRIATTATALALAAAGWTAAAVGTAHAGAYDDISMQKQEQSQWCWDASGNTVANWWGYNYSQTDFCNLANRATGVSCNNQPATPNDVAGAWRLMGFAHTGTLQYSAASFSQTRTEVDGLRPFLARIGWKSGGGHFNVIYGYDETNNTIAVADPWPATQTYTWWNYNDYVSNSSFNWTHTQIGVSAT
ncbi:papain-like cysteine protease family protein [Streptomyces nondiastaticus]|uniref:papain-like cysteine protease family protein n=1 Tax=Streptomyces TaxID=1883 RepID=UPI002675D7DA|nr:papain-like cysteine protease family protein [Streptomyces sp. VNUA116]WKU48755.1 papain-like cysteine protease family protein [Streptomyces sp. VNUA116]